MRLTALVAGLCLAAGFPALASEEDRPHQPLKQGVFLFAAPRLNDPNFLHSVVLLVSYEKEGSLGLIINRPTDISLDKALPETKGVEGLSQSLFFGGPVHQNLLLALFHADKPPLRTQKVFGDVYFSGEKQALMDAFQKGSPYKKVRVYAGYAGWAAGQLDREVGRGDWIITDADRETVFAEEPSEVWPALFGKGKKEIQIRGPETDRFPELLRTAK